MVVESDTMFEKRLGAKAQVRFLGLTIGRGLEIMGPICTTGNHILWPGGRRSA